LGNEEGNASFLSRLVIKINHLFHVGLGIDVHFRDADPEAVAVDAIVLELPPKSREIHAILQKEPSAVLLPVDIFWIEGKAILCEVLLLKMKASCIFLLKHEQIGVEVLCFEDALVLAVEHIFPGVDQYVVLVAGQLGDHLADFVRRGGVCALDVVLHRGLPVITKNYSYSVRFMGINKKSLRPFFS
jgi:hypothetical protein